MGDLSPNFSRYEFACKCGCGYDTVDAELVTVLQDLSDHFDNRAVTLSWGKDGKDGSGCRCEKHNKAEGGGKKSQHLLARAADIQVDGVDPAVVYAYLTDKYPDRYGIGGYATFTHIDTRRKRARWRG